MLQKPGLYGSFDRNQIASSSIHGDTATLYHGNGDIEIPVGERFYVFSIAIGQDNANGRIVLTRDAIDVKWRYAAENDALVHRMEDGMQAVAAIYGGSFLPLFTWQLFRRILTVHSLGGCHLSDSPDRGVVTPNGEVHSYPGLFVADGSLVPSSIGFHPCMTICALAERVAEHIVRCSA